MGVRVGSASVCHRPLSWCQQLVAVSVDVGRCILDSCSLLHVLSVDVRGHAAGYRAGGVCERSGVCRGCIGCRRAASCGKPVLRVCGMVRCELQCVRCRWRWRGGATHPRLEGGGGMRYMVLCGWWHTHPTPRHPAHATPPQPLVLTSPRPADADPLPNRGSARPC